MAVRFPDPIHPVDSVELEINKVFDRLIKCLQQRSVALLTTHRDTRAQIAARHTARTEKEQELKGLKTETEARLKRNELRDVQTRILAEIENELRELRLYTPEKRVVFRGNCGHLEQMIAGFGEVVEEQIRIGSMYEQMRPTLAVGKEGKTPGKLWEPRGVAIDEKTNRIYVAEEKGSCRVSVFSDTGAFINTFTHQDMIAPYGIAIHRDNLYVTDREVHAIFKFKIEADIRFVGKLGTTVFGIRRFYSPLGLSVSTNGDVFVADRNTNRVQIIDDSLHMKRAITHQTMRNPLDVKLTPDEVYVLCVGSPCILVFSHAGEKKRSLITQGMGMKIGSAFFFCLDTDRNLLFCDWENHQVRIFTKEGTHLCSIGQPGDKVGMFYFPRGIVLTKTRKLAIVSHNNNYSLQIFSCQ